MIQPVAILAALAGLGFALSALLLDGSGVTGSVGATLAAGGCLASLIGLLLLVTVRLPRGSRGFVATLTVLAAVLTAVAGWFLMQDALTIAMAIAAIAILGVAVSPRPLRRI